MLSDFKYSSQFDLELGRDFYPAYAIDRDVQLMRLRLLGDNPDFILHKDMCSSLEELIGENNNEVTGNKMYGKIIDSLTNDGAFVSSKLNVEVYPIDYSKLQADITYTLSDKGKSEHISETRVITI